MNIAIFGSHKHQQFVSELKAALDAVGIKVSAYNDEQHLFVSDVPNQGHRTSAKQLIMNGFDRIKAADICLFANIDGYMGISATLELGFSVASGKNIIALNHDNELTREVLFTTVLETEDVDSIVKKLRDI